MLSVKPQLTLQEFLALPAGDVTYELVEGQAIASIPSNCRGLAFGQDEKISNVNADSKC